MGSLPYRLVAAFLGGVRSALDHDQQYWTKAYVEQTRALCDRIEQLDPREAFQVVMLCRAGAKVDIQTAVETVEAIYQPPG